MNLVDVEVIRCTPFPICSANLAMENVKLSKRVRKSLTTPPTTADPRADAVVKILIALFTKVDKVSLNPVPICFR